MSILSVPAAPRARSRLAVGVNVRSRAAGLADDLPLLGWWGVAHAVLLGAAWCAAWTGARGRGRAPLAHVLQGWDANLLQSIAADGYFHGGHPNQVAFFPGYPLALRAAHDLVRSWIGAELALSFLAGALALAGLRRLAGTDTAGKLLLAAPAALFLMLGYTESLFLALAVWSWLLASRGRWQSAGLLAALAGTVRVNGLFLLAGLFVLALTRPSPAGRVRALLGVAPGLLGPWLYEVWMRRATGSWDAWRVAQRQGWGRTDVGLVRAFQTSWRGATGSLFGPGYAFEMQLEVASVLALAAGTAWLLWRRRWAEALYTGLTLYSLATSTWYESVPRALLLAFPLWAMLGRAADRRPWVGKIALTVSAPLCAAVALLYLTGGWAG